MIDASVIICTYRRDDVLRQTLEYLLTQRTSSVEYIVVDQEACHDEDTAAFLQNASQDGRISYYNLDVAGLTRARNFGARVAQGRILLYFDDDIVPCDNLIAQHLLNFQDDNISSVAGQVLHINESAAHAPGTFRHNKRVSPFQSLYGANFSIRKDVYHEIGGADEHLGIHAYTEDVLLAQHLCSLQKVIVYDPKASVQHLQHHVGGCRITDFTHRTHEEDRSHSKLYLYHKTRHRSDSQRQRIFWEALRHGPLRKHNVVRFWRQPYAWYAFLKAFCKAKSDASSSQ
ncbi:glycosyltransferase family 2 protein [Rubinisphaera brasiliensis]|uniref:Glycosyl transferase family 2 n=1 Tax=Rubinisphaera brasiliensis (strain ATCC 49424 / DSM 5305 / JCM 21570 / IAM 15109 / NBRC 103401 / IFAM 1448) TaxID=756272 RepID=F0SI50_RUBBR|nr:glycosyltransferase [Rubinisphaera brasiliensis]ADY61752.1 glycosyl transferase family 2 [Rubinisphaera brasiliensis DSM 5305]